MKPRLLLLFAVGLALAFALGRFSARAPDERIEVAEVEEVQERKEVEEVKEETARAEVEEERIRIVYRDRWRTPDGVERETELEDRKSTRLNSSHVKISYAVFCLKKK